MADKNKSWSRREFMKIAGVAGVGAVVSPVEHFAGAIDRSVSIVSGRQQVPKRPFGRTGVEVSSLALGGTVNFLSNQLLLRQALKMGVTCWDTSRNYIGGKSEKGIGKYFSRFPQDRAKVFLITKSGHSDPDNLTQHLYDSLQRMKTAYIDLFLIQAVSEVHKELTKAIQAWAEKAKTEGKIRYFGFSTHKKMEKCLSDGAKLGWIDGIMATYNYRLMHTDAMKKAVDACVGAGVGLIAMKTQASLVSNLFSDIGRETDAALRLNQQFIAKGFTTEQAKLKSVWENPSIASICSHMPSMKLLQANAAAASDKSALSSDDKRLMQRYARQTSAGYCTGCAEICERTIADAAPVGDILRYLMYYNSYGDQLEAIRCFNALPADIRRRIAQIDFSEAEKHCPQRMPLARLMREAVAVMPSESGYRLSPG